MNLTTGTFTAPRPGRYFFSFSGVAVMSSNHAHLDVSLYKNSEHIGRGETNSVNRWGRNGDDWETYTLQSVLDLRTGDQIWLSITSRYSSWLQDNDAHFTHFTGMLLEQDVFSS